MIALFMFLMIQKYSLYIPCVLIGPQSLVSCISVKHRTEPRRLHIPAQIINSSALTGFSLNCRLCRKPKKLHLTGSLPLCLTTKCINQAEKASVFAALRLLLDSLVHHRVLLHSWSCQQRPPFTLCDYQMRPRFQESFV